MMNRGRASNGMWSSRAPDVEVQAVQSKPCTRTYNQMPKNMATYVHMGGVSNAYPRICTTRARVHGEAPDGSNGVLFIGSQPAGSERTNNILFIGRQLTGSECVVFNGCQLAWTEQPERGLAYRKREENGLLFDRVWSKQGPVHREGSGVPQNGGNELVLDHVRSKWGPVDREGCGVPQNRGN
jgi:hypothetical protein